MSLKGMGDHDSRMKALPSQHALEAVQGVLALLSQPLTCPQGEQPIPFDIGQQPLTLSQSELDRLVGANDVLTPREIELCYAPLCQLILKHFLQSRSSSAPSTPKSTYLIGIAGGVAVGKSTTARVIYALLKQALPSVELVTTDHFLMPNHKLSQRNLLDKKGFPHSYETDNLRRFIEALKSDQSNDPLVIPHYSHIHYDIVPEQCRQIQKPPILILEGLNVLQQMDTDQGSFSLPDLLDFALFVHAEPKLIRQWYIERFLSFRKTYFQIEGSRWQAYAALSDEQAWQKAAEIYDQINGPNLAQHISPTQSRAHLMLNKGENHTIESIQLVRPLPLSK